MASQQSLEVPLTEPLVDPAKRPPASDDRWLLSCRFDSHLDVSSYERLIETASDTSGYTSLIERMLGEGVVSNPNRFSKTCCTIGEKWDNNYNKGDNAEKYYRCWEPDAPEELRCTKPVASGKEPTEMTCWKSSYFWRLKKCRKMLRIISDSPSAATGVKYPGWEEALVLGEGQEIEKNMADFLQREAGGCEVRILEFQKWNQDDCCAILHGTPGPEKYVRKSWEMLKHIPDNLVASRFLGALLHARELSENGFGNPFDMMIRMIHACEECELLFLARRVIDFQENDGFLVSEFYQKLCSELKSESSFETILGELKVIHSLSEFVETKLNGDSDELMTNLGRWDGDSMLMAWCYWRWSWENTVGLPSGELITKREHWAKWVGSSLFILSGLLAKIIMNQACSNGDAQMCWLKSTLKCAGI